MKFGWPISLIGHTLILGGGLIFFSRSITTEQVSRIVPVELLTVDELTSIRAAVRQADPSPQPDDRPMELENPMDHALEQGEAEQAVRETQPDIAEQSDLSPDESELAAEVKTPEEPAFNLDAMSELINRTREAQPEKNQQQSLQSEENIYRFAEMARAGAGDGLNMTVSELEALQSAMYKCWRIPLDAKNPEELGVRVRVKLRPDGGVSEVRLLDQARIAASPNPFLKTAAQRAVSAVSKCAPYDFLPPEKYSKWQDMTLNFVPEI